MNPKKLLTLFFIVTCAFLGSSLTANAQSFTETLSYINQHVNLDADFSTKSQGQKIKWSVTKDGKLVIDYIHRDGYVFDSRSIFLKNICVSTSCIEIDRLEHILEKGRYITYFVVETNESPLVVSINNEDSARKLKNAVTRLVTQAKANPNYKTKDAFDY